MEKSALELWSKWWEETDGNPYTGEECRRYCFFCNCDIESKHYDDCLYVIVSELLGKKIIK